MEDLSRNCKLILKFFGLLSMSLLFF